MIPLSSFLFHFSLGLRQQRFEMEPIDKTAIVGDTVILPCRVENKVGTLQCKFGLVCVFEVLQILAVSLI